MRKEHAMYATMGRRTRNEARAKEVREQAQREFFPKLRRAPGFVASYLIADGADNVGVVLWESKAHADAFKGEAEAWGRTLDEHGIRLVSAGGGEVTTHNTPEK